MKLNNSYESRLASMRGDFDKAIKTQKQQIGETENELAGEYFILIYFI